MATIPDLDPKNKISGDGKPFKGTIKHDILHKMLDGQWTRLMLVSEDGIDKYYVDGQLSGSESKEISLS